MPSKQQYHTERPMGAKKKKVDFHTVTKGRPDVAERCISYGGRFHLPVSALTQNELREVKQVLTIRPKDVNVFRNGKSKWRRPQQQEVYHMYTVLNGVLSVPAWYGFANWGPAGTDQTSLGLAVDWGDLTAFPLDNSAERPQVQARDAVHRVWREYEPSGAATCTLLMNCGSGKTLTSATAAAGMGRRVAFLAHRTDIADDIKATLEAVSGDRVRVGKVCEGRRDVGDEFGAVVFQVQTVVAMFRTMSSVDIARELRTETFGVLVVDEAHHYIAEKFMRVLFLFSCRYRLFMTATWEREDGKHEGFAAITGPCAYQMPPRTGHVDVALVRYTGLRTMPIPVTRAGETDFAALVQCVCDHEPLTEWGCSLVCSMLDAGDSVIVFTLRKHHIPAIAKKLYSMYQDKLPTSAAEEAPFIAFTFSQLSAAVRREFEALPGVFPFSSRDEEAFRHARQARVFIATVDMLQEGFNAKHYNRILYLMTRKAMNSAVQTLGRITRSDSIRREGTRPLAIDVVCEFEGCRTFVNQQQDRCRRVYRPAQLPMQEFTLDEDCALSMGDITKAFSAQRSQSSIMRALVKQMAPPPRQQGRPAAGASLLEAMLSDEDND